MTPDTPNQQNPTNNTQPINNSSNIPPVPQTPAPIPVPAPWTVQNPAPRPTPAPIPTPKPMPMPIQWAVQAPAVWGPNTGWLPPMQSTQPTKPVQPNMSFDNMTGKVAPLAPQPAAPAAKPLQPAAQNTNRKPQLQNVQKRGSKISMRWFIIGCFVFLVILFWGIGAALFYILQNPEQIWWAVDISTIEQGLRVFSILFFAFLFFLGFWMMVINAYRLATVKEWWKFKFVAWLFLSFFVLGWALWGGVVVLQSINQIAGNSQDTTNLVWMKVPTEPWPRYVHTSPGIQLIAPIWLTFELNRTAFERNLISTIWSNQVLKVALDCWNGQQVLVDLNTFNFDWTCLFQEKWNFPAQLIVTHVDLNNTVQQETILNAWVIWIASKIDLTTSLGAYGLNDAWTELNVWKAPSKVIVDANNVFEDYWIDEYQIDWDLEWDWVWDRTDDVSFAYNYKKPWINRLLYTIPALGDYVYAINFRIAQSDVPICEVSPEIIQDTTYNFLVICDDLSTPIVEYNFEILNFTNDKRVHVEKTTRPSLRYSFVQWWQYLIKLNYITNEWKKWQYESEVFTVGTVQHDVGYRISYKAVNDSDFKLVNGDSEATATMEDWTLIVKELPIELDLLIDSIVPLTQDTTPQVLINNRPVLSSNDRNFIFNITDQWDQSITILIKEWNDPKNNTEIIIPVEINQSTVIANLIAIWWTVWFDPFEVRLDASTTSLTDPDDEIIYFTWDFWDGVVNTNTSQGTIKHTYNYDLETENWEFMPTVTIKTKKGVEETIKLDNPILVKKKSIQAIIKTYHK